MKILPLTRSEHFLIGLIERYKLKYAEQPSKEMIIKFRRELVPKAIWICENEGWSHDHALERVLDEM